MSRKYVAVNDAQGSGVFCLGVFDDYYTALGKVMCEVWQAKESYNEKEGDLFQHDEMGMMEGECGEIMTVKYKHRKWEKEHEEYYYILYLDE